MKTKTVPLSVLCVANPTILGATIPLQRIVDTQQEEARLEKIGKKAEESAERFKNTLLQHTQPFG